MMGIVPINFRVGRLHYIVSINCAVSARLFPDREDLAHPGSSIPPFLPWVWPFSATFSRQVSVRSISAQTMPTQSERSILSWWLLVLSTLQPCFDFSSVGNRLLGIFSDSKDQRALSESFRSSAGS
jgi:hypothetical protein